MKKTLRMLLALALAVGMILGTAVPALAAQVRTETAQSERTEGLRALNAGEILAKSRKKKNSPTRTPMDGTKDGKNTPTPAPAGEEGGAAENAAPAEEEIRVTPTPVPEGPITDPQSIADYLFSHEGQLPENFITKKEAQKLGWDSRYNYVSDVAPGMSIGGDYFGNYEGKLPVGKGITYHEADCYYTKGKRNAYRVIYSSDGRVWYTEDHYNTFTELFPTVP